jgi:hypothetical protein
MLEAERHAIFARTWQYVGHADAVTEPGGYLACDIAAEPVLVARARDGHLRAFSNVCRHRGAVLASGSGTASAIRLIYPAISLCRSVRTSAYSTSVRGKLEDSCVTWAPVLLRLLAYSRRLSRVTKFSLAEPMPKQRRKRNSCIGRQYDPVYFYRG